MPNIKEAKPYIGVTGIANIEQAKIVGDTFKKHLKDNTAYEGMLGVLVSSSTLQDTERKDHPKYPNVKSLPRLLEASGEGAVNCIHFISKKPDSLALEVTKLFTEGEIYNANLCRKVQVNAAWPKVEELDKIKSKFPDLKIIIQLNKKALQEAEADIVSRLQDYSEVSDYVLIDPSEGQGKGFDPNYIARFYRLTKHTFPNKPVAFAGGFDNENVLPRLRALQNLLRTKNFGIDAQQGLRTNNALGQSELATEKAAEYISKSTDFFKK